MSQYRWFRHHLAALVTLGSFASAGCFVVEDSDSDDDESNGGEDSGGTSGAGGAISRGGNAGTSTSGAGGGEQGGNAGTPAGGAGGTTGGAPPTGGTGPAGGTGGSSSGAVMKFCNGLARGDMDITLTLTFAGVTASAISGACTPMVPTTCISIPTGTDPEVELAEGTEVILSGSFPTLTVAGGDELLVLAAIDPDTMMPGLFADTFVNFYGAGYSCASTDPATTEPPTMLRSTHFDLPMQWNLQNAALPSLFGDTKSLGASRLRQ